jgi:hypothetical protein
MPIDVGQRIIQSIATFQYSAALHICNIIVFILEVIFGKFVWIFRVILILKACFIAYIIMFIAFMSKTTKCYVRRQNLNQLSNKRLNIRK